MAGCKHIHRMSVFYDGEVAEEEHRQLREHIQHCTECAREFEQLRIVSTFLAAAQMPQLSPGALRCFHQVVNGASERIVFRTARAFAVAAAALLLVGVVWLWQTNGAQDAHGLAIPEWERAAVMQQVEFSEGLSAEAQLAQWIVEDLSRENAGD